MAKPTLLQPKTSGRTIDQVFAEVKARNAKSVVVLYDTGERTAMLDSGVSIAEILLMLECIKHWIIRHTIQQW